MGLIQILNNSAAATRQRFKNYFLSQTQHKSQPNDRQWELSTAETAAYDNYLARESSAPDRVDDRTWSDLEMEKIFLRLDKSVTPLGSQYLYTLLRNYQGKQASLAENLKAYKTLEASPETTTLLQTALKGLNRSESSGLADFLFGTPLVIPSRYQLFYLLSALAIACSVGIFLSPWFVPVAIGLWILNIVLYYVYGQKLARQAPSLISLANLLGCVPKISHAVRDLDLPELTELKTSAARAGQIQKQISLAFLRREGSDDLFRILIDYLNLFCLFELCALCRAIRAVNDERLMLRNLFHIVGRLDVFQGFAIALAGYPSICIPELGAGRSYSLLDVQHPLVNNPVCNSIEGTGNSLLLTGTNMAGKTTFIKTLAVNLLFSQTLGVCLARKAILPPARVRTMIAREDIIGSGQSYFYFEASELLRMLQDAERSGREYWFVLDEIFRGTNALERVAAGSAVLNHLNNHGLVIVSTHDHELTRLLRNDFDLYHFSEVISDKKAKFDYLLRKGPCTTRNAIKLLILAGYPKSVTDQAENLATSANVPCP
jgi:MutS domain V